MKIMFSKADDGRLCSWRAAPPKRRPFQGSTMASRAGRTELPHDLGTFVVEATLGLEYGFWNLVANGATFKSLGRRRTRPGRQLIVAHRKELDKAEGVVNAHIEAWRDGAPTLTGPALEAMLVRWQALAVGEELVVEWPTRRLGHHRQSPAAPQRPQRRPAQLPQRRAARAVSRSSSASSVVSSAVSANCRSATVRSAS